MYTIRYASIDDAEILGEIHSQSWKAAYRNIIPDEILDNITSEKRAEYFKKALKEGWEESAIIFEEDQAVGLISIGKCRDSDKEGFYGEIIGLYLLPEYWSVGIGTKLISWALDKLKERNYIEATLWVLEDNLKARKFYEKIGFKHDGAVKEIIIGKRLYEYRYVKVIA